MADPSDPNMARLQAIDVAALTPLVRQALGKQTFTIQDWVYQPLHGGIGGSVGGTFLYRFSGQGRSQDNTAPWSLILKVLQSRSGEIPSDTHYWKREAEAYRSDLLSDLPGEMFAAQAFGVVEYPDEACWIWLEDLDDVLGRRWPLEHYGVVARHLGQFNGAYLGKRVLPSVPWLSTHWFQNTLARFTVQALPNIHQAFVHPLVRQHFPSAAHDQYTQLWEQREKFMSLLDRLPQTLCHLDAFRRNLFARHGTDGRYETVAIDWAHIGRAAIGLDAAVLLQVSLIFLEIETADAQELVSVVFDGYLNGLRDAGWQGDPRLIRLGFAIAAVLKYLEMSGAITFLADPVQQERIEKLSGRPIADSAQQLAAMHRLTFDLAEKAQGLFSLLE